MQWGVVLAVAKYLADVWSATDFREEELGRYAEPLVREDTRQGVQTLASLSLLVNLLAWFLVFRSGAGALDSYSHLALAALSIHIFVSALFIHEIRALQVLGVVLIVVSALAIVFVAHTSGDLSIGMMAAIIMLVISTPLIPWGLREATIVIGLLIALLTSSVMSVPGRFNLEAFWLLELLVLGSTAVVGLLVARNTVVRKQDIRARFDLDVARKEMKLLSLKDHLTGAWNRRYFETEFPRMAEECRGQRKTLHVAILDIDDFKGINDQYGHQLADQVLSGLSEIFIRQLGDIGRLVRLGGDEFLILYCGDDLRELIKDVVAELHKQPGVRKITTDREISMSAGFSSAGPNDVVGIEKLYSQADRALYAMKRERAPVKLVASGEDLLSRTGSWKL